MLEKKCETCYWESRTFDWCFRDNANCFDDRDGEKRNWKPYTHGNAIRNMSDEELGEMIFRMTEIAMQWDRERMQTWLESQVSEKRGFWG